MSFTVKNYNSATNMSNLYDEIITNSINGFDITNMEEWSKLTADEIKQLQNIDENKISNTAWSRVSNMQDVGPSSSPTFYNNHFNEGTGSSNLYFTDARSRAAISAGTGIIYDMTTGTISNTIETTSDLPEGTNLYYTTARAASGARAAISAGTGIIYDMVTGTISNTIETTSDLPEGTNLYFTDARASSGARNAISAGTGIIYDMSTGVISNTVRTTSDLPEGTNLYFTDTRASSGARNAITGSSPISYNAATGVIGLNYVSTNLTMTGSSLNTVQNIGTGANPFFNKLNLKNSDNEPSINFYENTGPTGVVNNYRFRIIKHPNSGMPLLIQYRDDSGADIVRFIMRGVLGSNTPYDDVFIRGATMIQGNTSFISGNCYVERKLGIGSGMTGPSSQLHIASDSKTDSIINLEREGGKRTMLAAGSLGSALGYDASGYLALGSITGPGFTGWNEKIRITPSGTVGIGLSNPSHSLHLYKTDASQNSIMLQHNDSKQQQAFYYSKPGTVWATYAPGSSTDFRIWNGVVNKDVINVKTDGKVGIGLDMEPSTRLSIKTASTGVDGITMQGANTDMRFVMNNENGPTGARSMSITNYSGLGGLVFQGLSNTNVHVRDIMTISHTGYVGIGTIYPLEKLHVNGNIRCDNLTQNMYVKTDANKNLSSTGTIPYSDITNPPVVSSGSFSPVLSTINWASGTGAIDNSMHHYLRAANFCELSGRTLITPTDSKCSWLGYNMTVPVNHTGFVSSYIFSGNGLSKTTLIPAFEAYASYPTDYTTLRMYFNFPPAGDTSYTVNYRITYSI